MRPTKLVLTLDSLSVTFNMLNVSTSDKYILKKVIGLDAPSLTLFMTKPLNASKMYKGHSLETREVVFTFEINPNYSILETMSELRQVLYQFLSIKQSSSNQISLSIYDEIANTSLVTYGYVTKIESDVFSKTPDIQLTFSCLSPYLFGPETVVGVVNDTVYSCSFTKLGTAPAEFSCRFKLTNNSTGIQFWEPNGSPLKALLITGSFITDDIFTITSYSGQRAYTLTRSGVTNSVVGLLSATSDWFELVTATPTLSVITGNSGVIFQDVRYVQRYWGV